MAGCTALGGKGCVLAGRHKGGQKLPCAGASRDPPEKQAPMCTLHSFPHNIDHCLTFARSEFEGLLEKSPAEANAFLGNPAKYLETVRQVGVAS